MVQGVNTSELGYYNGKELHHFNGIYGYNASSSTKWIKMLEVFNPVKLYGSTPWYGNPYGHRSATLGSAFTANDISCPSSDRRRLII